MLQDVPVQRRAQVTVEVRTADGRSVKTLSTMVAPDAPNDLELVAGRVDGDGVLIAELPEQQPDSIGRQCARRRAPARVPPYTLLARTEATLDVDAGGVQYVRLGHVGPIDVDHTWIGLTTDAIGRRHGNDVLGENWAHRRKGTTSTQRGVRWPLVVSEMHETRVVRRPPCYAACRPVVSRTDGIA